jgi:hypothetical protein
LVRRSLRFGLEIVGTLVAGLVILVGFAAYRFSEGRPFHLAFLVPYIERALAPADSAFHVKLDDLVIAWTGGQRLVGLRATHVRAVTGDGHVLASVPQIGLSLSLRALLRGLIAPTEVEIYNPRIHLRRERDGSLHFLASPSGNEEGQPTQLIPEFLQGLMGPPNLDHAMGYLRRALLIGGTLDFDDQRTGVVWHAPKIDIELLRDRQGIDGKLSSQIRELGDPALFDADFVYDSASGDIRVTGRFSGLDISSLGLIAPDLMAVSGSHLQFNGAVDTTLNVDGHLGGVHFTLGGGPGSVDLPARFPKPVPIRSLSLVGELEPGFDSLAISELTLDLGGPVISARARLSGLESYGRPKIGRLRVAGEASAAKVSVARLSDLWPVSESHADNARKWVLANIDTGQVDEAKVAFDLDFPGGDLDQSQVTAFAGSMKASGLGLHYLRPLPPIRGASGSATFDATKFAAEFSGGGVGNLVIRTAHLAITGLDKTDQLIAVEGDVDGPMKEALELLNHPPLGYPAKMHLDPATSGGTTAVHLTLQFPASKSLKFEQVRIAAHARIEQARFGNVFLHNDLTEGNFELALDGQGMVAQGSAKLADIPATLRWDSHFNAPDFRTRIAIAAETSATDLARLGFDYRDLLQGPLHLELTYIEPHTGLTQITIAFDLTKTAAAIDFAKWEKPPGVPAKADLTLTMDGEHPVAITRFQLATTNLSGSGTGRFDAKGKLVHAEIRGLTLDKTKLNQVVLDFAGPRVDIAITGGQFDAEPFIGKSELQKQTPATDEGPTRPYSISAENIDRVLVGPDRQIEKVRGSAAFDGLHWQRIEANGTTPGGKPMTLGWLAGDGASHRLSIVAEDAGSALKVLGIIDDVRGGRLTITGTASDSDPKRAITGHAEVSEYRLVNQSALVRLLTIATLTGIADALTGEGFEMYRFVGDFTKTGGRIDVPLARTWGPSLGLTATGFLDYGTDQINVEGTVVPAYALNSLVGQIPIVGFLLTGGKGSGLFAAVYSATGKLSEPSISVNPLSALAPGFLRGVFGLFSGGSSGDAGALPPNYARKGSNK